MRAALIYQAVTEPRRAGVSDLCYELLTQDTRIYRPFRG